MYLRDTLGAIILYVTHKCNLKCSYCLNNYNGACNDKDLDSDPDYLNKLVNFVNSLEQDIVYIVYFGGEPTLRWDICKDIYYYLLQNSTKDIRFIVQTNGTTIHNIIDDLKVMDKVTITLSIDADKENHDKYRIYHNGNGSWNDIKNNISLLLREGFEDRLTLACCLWYGDVNMFEKVKFLYEELKVKKIKTTFIKEVEIKPEYMDISLIGYKKIADYLIEHPDKIYYRFGLHSLDNKESLYQDYQQFRNNNCTDMCRAGVYKVWINTDGNIYPCHSLMRPQHLLGNIFTNTINTKLAYKFDNFYNNCINCINKKGCMFCAYKVYYDTGSILMCNNVMKNSCKNANEALTYYYEKCKEHNYIE